MKDTFDSLLTKIDGLPAPLSYLLFAVAGALIAGAILWVASL